MRATRVGGLARNDLYASITVVDALGLSRHRRTLLAVANNLDLRARSAINDEVVEDAVRATLAEGEIVLARSALIRVTLETESLARVSCEVAGVIRERLPVRRAEFGDVEIEVEHRLAQGVFCLNLLLAKPSAAASSACLRR